MLLHSEEKSFIQEPQIHSSFLIEASKAAILMQDMHRREAISIKRILILCTIIMKQSNLENILLWYILYNTKYAKTLYKERLDLLLHCHLLSYTQVQIIT